MKTPGADHTLEFKKEAELLVQGGQRQSEGCLPGPVSSQTMGASTPSVQYPASHTFIRSESRSLRARARRKSAICSAMPQAVVHRAIEPRQIVANNSDPRKAANRTVTDQQF